MTKVVNYKVNGSGRDTYINYGNGGFYKSDSLHTEDSFCSLSKQNSLPIINSKFKLYHTDGTGRDSYISEGQGGFYSYQPKLNFQADYDAMSHLLRPSEKTTFQEEANWSNQPRSKSDSSSSSVRVFQIERSGGTSHSETTITQNQKE